MECESKRIVWSRKLTVLDFKGCRLDYGHERRDKVQTERATVRTGKERKRKETDDRRETSQIILQNDEHKPKDYDSLPAVVEDVGCKVVVQSFGLMLVGVFVAEQEKVEKQKPAGRLSRHLLKS